MSKPTVPRGQPGPALKAVEAVPSSAMKVLTDIRMAADHAQSEIAKARAALWVLDQLEYGELSFVNHLHRRDPDAGVVST